MDTPIISNQSFSYVLPPKALGAGFLSPAWAVAMDLIGCFNGLHIFSTDPNFNDIHGSLAMLALFDDLCKIQGRSEALSRVIPVLETARQRAHRAELIHAGSEVRNSVAAALLALANKVSHDCKSLGLAEVLNAAVQAGAIASEKSVLENQINLIGVFKASLEKLVQAIDSDSWDKLQEICPEIVRLKGIGTFWNDNFQKALVAAINSPNGVHALGAIARGLERPPTDTEVTSLIDQCRRSDEEGMRAARTLVEQRQEAAIAFVKALADYEQKNLTRLLRKSIGEYLEGFSRSAGASETPLAVKKLLGELEFEFGQAASFIERNGPTEVIYDAGVAMERHPSVYSGKDEEALRDHFLTILSSHFHGTTGETFNKKGKTDILIRQENQNVFVAECKFWSGIKAFHKTIDQLLGYLTWRDSNAAIILFVRNTELTRVLEDIEKETSSHPCFVKNQGKKKDGWFIFEFHLPGEPGRSVQVAVLEAIRKPVLP